MRTLHRYEIAGLCYEKQKHGRKVFATVARLYHGGRRHWAGIRITELGDLVSLMTGRYFIGNALMEDPPFIEGRIMERKKEIGHIHTRQSADGRKTQYYGQFTEVPQGDVFLRIKLEDSS